MEFDINREIAMQKKKSEKQKKLALMTTGSAKASLLEVANYHKQYVKWLEELRERRIIDSKANKNKNYDAYKNGKQKGYSSGMDSGYEECIKDFARELRNGLDERRSYDSKYTYLDESDVEEIIKSIENGYKEIVNEC